MSQFAREGHSFSQVLVYLADALLLAAPRRLSHHRWTQFVILK